MKTSQTKNRIKCARDLCGFILKSQLYKCAQDLFLVISDETIQSSTCARAIVDVIYLRDFLSVVARWW